MFELIVKLFGLDKKAGQLALEYALWIALGAAFLIHLGDTLIAVGNCLVILSGAVSQLSSIGSVGILATVAKIKMMLASTGPILKAASPDIHWCIGALIAGAAYLKIKLDHAANAGAIQSLKAATLPDLALKYDPPASAALPGAKP